MAVLLQKENLAVIILTLFSIFGLSMFSTVDIQNIAAALITIALAAMKIIESMRTAAAEARAAKAEERADEYEAKYLKAVNN